MKEETGNVLVFVLVAVFLVITTVAVTSFYLGKGSDALFGFFADKQNVELDTADTGKTKEQYAAINQKLNELITPTSTPTATPKPTDKPTAAPTKAPTTTNTSTTASNTSNSLSIGLAAKDNGAVVEWSGDSANGFKVCYSENANPSYPESNCTYKNASDRRHEVGGLTAGKTYHFRVGIYGTDGKVNVYSSDATVVPTGSTASTSNNSNQTLNLTASSNETGKVTMNWTLNGDGANGFKEVWSTDANPTYPEDHWHYDSSTGLRTFDFSELPSGQTLHFRVGIYGFDGKVSTYSNDVTVTVK